MNAEITGKIKFYKNGYGFIIYGDNKEIYYHITGCVSKVIQKDDQVTFEITETNRGPQAMNVKVIRNGNSNQ